MSAVRPAAVAGMFYPEAPGVLGAQVRAYLEQAGHALPSAPRPKALIVPHAGYVYSGAIAAAAYARLAGLTRALDLPQVSESDRAHALEHSLEVQLPFLQLLLGSFRVVPLAVGDATAAEVAEVIELLWGGPETLIVISSDLSHYHTYRDAQSIDQASAQTVLALSPTLGYEQACGALPINGLLTVARRRALRPELLDLRNSGDTAGDKFRVVGYASFVFSEGQA